jgi:hypothetical protein
VGAVVSAAALGALLGWVGQLVSIDDLSPSLRLGLLALVLLVGLVVDVGAVGLRLPTVRRQVNEDWLRAYRGWVYGLAFGAQLGLGLVTIATSSTVYVTFFVSLLSAAPLAGAVVAAAFGALRWATLLPAGRVTQSAQLIALGGAIRRFESPARQLVLGSQAMLAALAILAAGTVA